MTETGAVLLVVGHSAGGIGGHVASLAARLPEHGWTTTVGTSTSTAARFDFGTASVRCVWPERGDAAQAVRALRRLVADADVVHAHGHQAGLLSVAVAATLPRRHRPPVVVSWHNAVLGSGLGRGLRGVLERVQARRADLVTGASQDLVQRALRLGATGARLAPVAAPDAGTWSGDRAAERASVAAELGIDPRGPWVLTVSRIAPQKHLPVLVDAAARLRERPGLVWLVVGGGDAGLLGELRRRAVASGAPVRFLGSRSDVVALMALADVFALSSAWEARALVVQEAMAAGTPVVATAVGGLPELVGTSGVLVPAGDAAALGAAVDRLLDDPEEAARLGQAGRERFVTLPTEDDVVSQWSATYHRFAQWVR